MKILAKVLKSCVVKLLKENPLCLEHLFITDGEIPPCCQCISDKNFSCCHVSHQVKDSLESIKSKAYRFGYMFCARVVLKGPRCKVVFFRQEPDAKELEVLYGNRLITILLA